MDMKWLLVISLTLLFAACAGDASTPTPVPPSLGPLALYESSEYPFSIQYAAEWTEVPLTGFPSVVMWRRGPQEEWFIIVEHSSGSGQRETLSGYVDWVIDADSRVDAEHEMVSRERTKTAQGLPAELLEYTILWTGIPMTVTAFIYVHDNRVGFRAAYAVPTSIYEDMKSSIDHSLSTFNVAQ